MFSTCVDQQCVYCTTLCTVPHISVCSAQRCVYRATMCVPEIRKSTHTDNIQYYIDNIRLQELITKLHSLQPQTYREVRPDASVSWEYTRRLHKFHPILKYVKIN